MGLNFAKVFHKAAELSEENQPANKNRSHFSASQRFLPNSFMYKRKLIIFPFDIRPQLFHDWTALDKSLSNNSGSLGCTYAINNDYTVDSPIEAPTKLRKIWRSHFNNWRRNFSPKTETVTQKFQLNVLEKSSRLSIYKVNSSQFYDY